MVKTLVLHQKCNANFNLHLFLSTIFELFIFKESYGQGKRISNHKRLYLNSRHHMGFPQSTFNISFVHFPAFVFVAYYIPSGYVASSITPESLHISVLNVSACPEPSPAPSSFHILGERSLVLFSK